jgi:hypothetical protein
MNPPPDAKVETQTTRHPSPHPGDQPAPTDNPSPPLITRPAILRFALALAALIVWLLYLGYLVWTLPERGRSVDRLSNPQVLASNLDVVATVTSPDAPVTVMEVLYPKKDESKQLVGQSLEVTNLDDCRAPSNFTGPGKYLLLLEPAGEGKLQVVRVPLSPGYLLPSRDNPPRIYPATDEILSQYREAPKPAER